VPRGEQVGQLGVGGTVDEQMPEHVDAVFGRHAGVFSVQGMRDREPVPGVGMLDERRDRSWRIFGKGVPVAEPSSMRIFR